MNTTINLKGVQDTDRVLTVPNVVTMLRLILLFPVCWLILTRQINLTALILLAVWASTDWVDGLLARLLRQRSTFGQILDPVTDRVGIALVLASITIVGILPWGLIAAVVVTDVVAAAVVGRPALRGDLGVSRLGKARTGILFVGIVFLIMAELVPLLATPAFALVLIAVILHVLAGLGYVLTVLRSRVSS